MRGRLGTSQEEGVSEEMFWRDRCQIQSRKDKCPERKRRHDEINKHWGETIRVIHLQVRPTTERLLLLPKMLKERRRPVRRASRSSKGWSTQYLTTDYQQTQRWDSGTLRLEEKFGLTPIRCLLLGQAMLKPTSGHFLLRICRRWLAII